MATPRVPSSTALAAISLRVTTLEGAAPGGGGGEEIGAISIRPSWADNSKYLPMDGMARLATSYAALAAKVGPYTNKAADWQIRFNISAGYIRGNAVCTFKGYAYWICQSSYYGTSYQSNVRTQDGSTFSTFGVNNGYGYYAAAASDAIMLLFGQSRGDGPAFATLTDPTANPVNVPFPSSVSNGADGNKAIPNDGGIWGATYDSTRGRFFAVGYSNTAGSRDLVMSSTDPLVRWDRHATGIDKQLYAVNSNGVLVVVAGESGSLATADLAADGTVSAFTARNSRTTQTIRHLKWIPFLNRWLGLCDGGRIIIGTADGKTWTPSSIPGLASPMGIAIVNGLVLVFGQGNALDGVGRVSASSTLATWEPRFLAADPQAMNEPMGKPVVLNGRVLVLSNTSNSYDSIIVSDVPEIDASQFVLDYIRDPAPGYRVMTRAIA